MNLAVIIPVYNERALLPAAVSRLRATQPPPGCERTLILIDDGSTDGSREWLHALEGDDIAAVFHENNKGKGAAVRTGLAAALARGADLMVIHDADLEYDPADHAAMLAPILDGRADAVIGSRFLGQAHRVLYYWHYLANRCITQLCDMATNLNLTDIECCLKAFRREVAQRLQIEENGFGIEPELIAKLARMRLPEGDPPRPLRIFEVPVSYAGRTYAEGKKITWKDGIGAIACILKYALRG